MKKYFLFMILGLFSFLASAQNSSFGVKLSGMDFENKGGFYTSVDLRMQLTERFGWSTEVGYGRQNSTVSGINVIYIVDEFGFVSEVKETYSSRPTFMTLKTGLTTKIFSHNGLSLEGILSGGMYKGKEELRGLLSGELFLSTQITKNLVAGIPIGYHFVTWDRDRFYTAGLSLRYHL